MEILYLILKIGAIISCFSLTYFSAKFVRNPESHKVIRQFTISLIVFYSLSTLTLLCLSIMGTFMGD